MTINGKTLNLGVIGCPVEHSISPRLQNTMAELLGCNAVYGAYRVEPGRMEAATEGMRALSIRGLNVTIPHKTEAFRLADALDPFAEKMGAVNTLVNDGGVITGYNTDGRGFIRSLAREGVTAEEKVCVILGAGGAAMGVAMALAESGALLYIKNRTEKKASALAERINRYYPGRAFTGGEIADADILVNATSVGMNTAESPLSDSEFDKLKSTAVVTDIVYCPRKTAFLSSAEKRGLKTVGGIGMLINQAVLAFELFTGKAVPERAVSCLYKMTEMKKNIVLTGFMGTGKSSVARELGRSTRMKVIDTDERIEDRYGEIKGIFSLYGEEYFRELETKTIAEAAKSESAVISLGGGAVLKKENIDECRKNGFIVRLKADIEKVFQNIAGDSDSRPLLSGKTKEEAAALLESRERFYKNCDCEIDVTSLTSREAAEKIIEEYYDFCLKEAIEIEYRG